MEASAEPAGGSSSSASTPAGGSSSSASTPAGVQSFTPTEPKINIPIPELPKNWKEIKNLSGNMVSIPWIAQYIIAWYKRGIIFAAIVAVVAFMTGGFLYILAGGIPSNVERAKSLIFSSLAGMVLILSSHLILNIINPELTNLKGLPIEVIKKIELPDAEEHPKCNSISDDPLEAGVAEDKFAQYFSEVRGRFLQIPAALDFQRWMEALSFNTPLNSAYRSSKKQKCLKENLPKLAARACSSNHEYGLAVDMQVKTLTTAQYKELVDEGKKHNFKNFVYASGSAVPDDKIEEKDGKEITVSPWKEVPERWHFDYVGEALTRDWINLNPECVK